jgi:hypothetical protein
MSAPYSPPWVRGGMPRRGSRYSEGHLRVGDAERADVADRLSKHYADGRLDQAEFNQRLDQAMSAKTQFDLHGLFADLPPIDGSDIETRRPRRSRGHTHDLLFLVLVIALVATIGHLILRFYVPWLLVAVFVAVWLHHGFGRRR